MLFEIKFCYLLLAPIQSRTGPQRRRHHQLLHLIKTKIVKSKIETEKMSSSHAYVDVYLDEPSLSREDILEI